MKVANMRLVRLHFDDIANKTYETYITFQQANRLRQLLSEALSLSNADSVVSVGSMTAILTPNEFVDNEITIDGLRSLVDGSDGTGDPNNSFGTIPDSLSLNIHDAIALMQYLDMFPKL